MEGDRVIIRRCTKAELKKRGIRFRREQDGDDDDDDNDDDDDEEEDSDDFDDDDDDEADWTHGRKGSMATDLVSSKKNDIS